MKVRSALLVEQTRHFVAVEFEKVECMKHHLRVETLQGTDIRQPSEPSTTISLSSTASAVWKLRRIAADSG